VARRLYIVPAARGRLRQIHKKYNVDGMDASAGKAYFVFSAKGFGLDFQSNN
jgi:hypothetical protein